MSLVFLFAVGSDLVSYTIMPHEFWVPFILSVAYYGTLCMAILLPTSYLNKQSQYQMKRLMKIREIYQRIVRD